MCKTHTQKGFDAGAISIKDPDKRIYAFFKKCPSAVRTHATTYADKCAIDRSAYSIDVTQDAFPSDFIPGKVSVYVTRDEPNGMTFIRPESKSRTTYTDLGKHAISGIASQGRKWLSFLGTPNKHCNNDAPEHNKPHIPHDVYDRYINMINTYIPYEIHNDWKQVARLSDIRSNCAQLYTLCQAYDTHTTSIRRTINYIDTTYDYPWIRHGNEIIFGRELIALAYKYALEYKAGKDEKDKQHIQCIETYSDVLHTGFLYRHPHANYRHAHDTNTMQVDMQIAHDSVQSFLSYYEEIYTCDNYFPNNSVASYIDTIAQQLTSWRYKNALEKERAIRTHHLLDDVTCRPNSQ